MWGKIQSLADWRDNLKWEKIRSMLPALTRGWKQYNQNNLGAAIEAFQEAISINPNYGYSHYSLGLTYDKMRLYEKAIPHYKQAIRLDPDSSHIYVKLGYDYIFLSRWQEAYDAYKQAIRIDPDNIDAHIGLAACYDQQGRLQEAVKAMEQALLIDPNHARANFLMGGFFATIGQTALALEKYKILKEIDKDLAAELFNSIYK